MLILELVYHGKKTSRVEILFANWPAQSEYVRHQCVANYVHTRCTGFSSFKSRRYECQRQPRLKPKRGKKRKGTLQGHETQAQEKPYSSIYLVYTFRRTCRAWVKSPRSHPRNYRRERAREREKAVFLFAGSALQNVPLFSTPSIERSRSTDRRVDDALFYALACSFFVSRTRHAGIDFISFAP